MRKRHETAVDDYLKKYGYPPVEVNRNMLSANFVQLTIDPSQRPFHNGQRRYHEPAANIRHPQVHVSIERLYPSGYHAESAGYCRDRTNMLLL